MTKSKTGASADAQPISGAVLLGRMSELVSLREEVEQAELIARIYGESVARRRRELAPSGRRKRLPMGAIRAAGRAIKQVEDPEVQEMREMPLREIAAELTRRNTPAPRGGSVWNQVKVMRATTRLGNAGR
jgi:hypothetical protein